VTIDGRAVIFGTLRGLDWTRRVSA